MSAADGGWLPGLTHIPSPNFGERPEGTTVDLIVLHNISLPPGEFGGPWIADFFLNRLDTGAHPYFAEIGDLQVSAHFLIRRDGEIVQFVPVDRRAWHAGRSCWQKRENCNDYSLGVELEGADDLLYTPEQYGSLWSLLESLCVRFPITAIAGHCHVAPGRKTDPGQSFDWSALAERFPDLALPPEVLS